jgi:hypothetical protein
MKAVRQAWMIQRDAASSRLFSAPLRGTSVCIHSCRFSSPPVLRGGTESRHHLMNLKMAASGARLTVAVEEVMHTAMPGGCDKRRCGTTFGTVLPTMNLGFTVLKANTFTRAHPWPSFQLDPVVSMMLVSQGSFSTSATRIER